MARPRSWQKNRISEFDQTSWRDLAPTARDDQMRIAELVPEVAEPPRLVVSALEVTPGANARLRVRARPSFERDGDEPFEHREMRRLRLVQAGNQPRHRPQRPIRRDDRSEEHTSELQSLRHLVCR